MRHKKVKVYKSNGELVAEVDTLDEARVQVAQRVREDREAVQRGWPAIEGHGYLIYRGGRLISRVPSC